MKSRSIFILGLLMVVIGFTFKVLYRPMIYSSDINDFGFADGSPSLFYVIGLSLLLMINKIMSPLFIITTITSGSILYECYQYLKYDSLDLTDIIYSVIGGILTWVVWKTLALQ